MDLGSALMALLIGGIVKGGVMLFGAWLLVKVYRATHGAPPRRPWLLLPQEELPEVRLLWWSLVLFYVSELTCGIEIYVILQSSPLFTGIHSVTSSLGMSLFALGLYLQLDRKLLCYGQRRCIAVRICRHCTIEESEGCKFRLIVTLIATFVALAAVAPLFASTARMAADTRKYILPFPDLNAWYDRTIVPWCFANIPNYQPSGAAYYLPESMFVIEFRIIPLLALALAGAAIILSLRDRVVAATKVLMLSAGMLCYAYFELVLYRGMDDVLMGSLGHEVAEFWFLVFTAEYLQRCYPAVRQEAATAAVPAT